MQDIVADEEIAAILPRYTELGDCSVLHTCDGSEVLVPSRIKTVVHRLVRRECKDIYLLEEQARKLTKGKNWMPLVLGPELVLVSLKVRNPKISGDVTAGFFNYCQINGLQEKGRRTILCMKNGQSFLVLWNKQTVEAHLRNALLVLAMEQRHLDRIALHYLEKRWGMSSVLS